MIRMVGRFSGKAAWLSAAALVGVVTAWTGTATAADRPLATVKVKNGYIDSNFAVSPNGKYLAFLQVEDNRKAHLTVMTLTASGAKRKARVPAHMYTVMPLRLYFTEDSSKILMFWRANPTAISGPVTGVVLSLNGQKLGVVPPFEDFRLRKTAGKWQAITYTTQTKRWSVWHLVTVYSFPNMRRVAQYRLITDKVGNVAKPKMELVYFTDDYLKAVAKVPGRYDKAKDIRLPDREAIYDMAQRKVVSQRDIKEAVRWERNKLFRQKHNAFDPVVVTEGTGKRAHLELVRTDNSRTRISMDMPLQRFRPKSLRQQFLPGGVGLLSLTVDPQNPITLKQRRSEPEVFHLFAFTLADAARPRRAIKLNSANQVLYWSCGKSFLAVMRLHQNWRLGRAVLEIYKVPVPR